MHSAGTTTQPLSFHTLDLSYPCWPTCTTVLYVRRLYNTVLLLISPSHNCCVSMLGAWTSNCEHRVFWLPLLQSWINGWSSCIKRFVLLSTDQVLPWGLELPYLWFVSWQFLLAGSDFLTWRHCLEFISITTHLIVLYKGKQKVSYTTIINYCAIHKPHTVQLETTCKTTLNPLPSELCHLQHGVFSFIAAVIDVVTSAAAAVAGVVFILLTLLLLSLLLFLLLFFS